MRIDKATEKYEAWLSERLTLIREDVALKHKAMYDGVFPFLRATFYRWAQTFPEVCPELMKAPEVLGVGDLHVENFGTWRDTEGRLIWGINDFDEACRLPYTCDLVRLAASALVAIDANHLSIIPKRASRTILDGYTECVKAGGGTFVLAEQHRRLRFMATERLKNPEKFWTKLTALPDLEVKCPESAEEAMREMLPENDLKCRIVHRVGGLGSLGRQRFAMLTEWGGANVAREAKELTESAWFFAHPTHKKNPVEYEDAMDGAVRCPDPFVCLKKQWVVRRLAPDCSRIELELLPTQRRAQVLLYAMGWETANVHLGTGDAQKLLKDAGKRRSGWLHAAATAMMKSTIADWKEWRRRVKKGRPPLDNRGEAGPQAVVKQTRDGSRR